MEVIGTPGEMGSALILYARSQNSKKRGDIDFEGDGSGYEYSDLLFLRSVVNSAATSNAASSPTASLAPAAPTVATTSWWLTLVPRGFPSVTKAVASAPPAPPRDRIKCFWIGAVRQELAYPLLPLRQARPLGLRLLHRFRRRESAASWFRRAVGTTCRQPRWPRQCCNQFAHRIPATQLNRQAPHQQK